MISRKIFLIVVMLSILNILYAQEKVVISAGPRNDSSVMIVTPIIIETYRRININAEIKNNSWARSISLTNKGIVDAELFRTKMITEKYKNIEIVNEPVLFLELFAFTNKRNISIKTWKDLASYRIAFLRGVKIVEDNTKEYSVVQVDTIEKAFILLDKNKVDIVVAEYITGKKVLKSKEYKNISILDTPLERVPVYHFVHNKNRELIPLIEMTLKEMMQDGTLYQIQSNVIYQILNK